MHAFVSILDAPRISDETEYKSFVKRTIRLKCVLVADLLQLPPVMGKPVYVTVDGCDSNLLN